jgi:hypothetical protein
MKLLFNYKNINKVNLFLLLLYVLVIILFSAVNNSQKVNDTAVVEKVTEKSRYNKINTDITAVNGKVLSFSFTNSFFDRNKFLNIEKGDSLSYYTNSSDEIISITNVKKNNTLGVVYFTIESLIGFQYLIMLLLLVYNAIHLVNLYSLNKIVASNAPAKRYTTLQALNNFTKKYFLITAVFIVVVIYFAGSLFGLIKNNQNNFQYFSFYKYLHIFFAVLIPVPFIIKNYFLLKKLNHTIN